MAPENEYSPAGPFELSGGALCLDFANTWGNQADPGSDLLRSGADLVVFSRQTESLPPATIDQLALAFAADPEQAGAALSFGADLRSAIYRVFSSRAGGLELPQNDFARINTVLGEAMSSRRLEPYNGGFVWSWAGADPGDLRTPLWPVVESAALLLTSADIERVRECNAGDCNWLFLDRSRAGTRRWCSMSSCGNRAKARRHYRRKKS